MSIETEAVQVAAVAAALVEDCVRPTRREAEPAGRRAGRKWWDPRAVVLGMIHDERKRQDEKWGKQRHTPTEWLMILAEEVGELAAAVFERGEGEDDATSPAAARLLGEAGLEARKWINGHRWPERQQRVIDEERE